MVGRKDIDVVEISTPGHLHYPIAAAAAGKHIICEKLMVNSLAEAKEMLQAVEKVGVKHMASFSYRHIPAIAWAKRIIEEGRLGGDLPY